MSILPRSGPDSAARDKTAGEISDARLEDFEKLTAAYEPPSELAPELIGISTTGAASDSVRAILLRLAERQAGALPDAPSIAAATVR